MVLFYWLITNSEPALIRRGDDFRVHKDKRVISGLGKESMSLHKMDWSLRKMYALKKEGNGHD